MKDAARLCVGLLAWMSAAACGTSDSDNGGNSSSSGSSNTVAGTGASSGTVGISGAFSTGGNPVAVGGGGATGVPAGAGGTVAGSAGTSAGGAPDAEGGSGGQASDRCPPSAPNDGTECGSGQGGAPADLRLCEYPDESCACGFQGKWTCFGGGGEVGGAGGVPGFPEQLECPSSLPSDGDDCLGYGLCAYGEAACGCNNDSWNCF